MQDLEGQYDEDLLIFVGRMLQKIYGSENIENHKLAPWIAEVTKEIGKAPYDIDDNDRKMTSAVHAFEMILNYIKSENDSEESISNITSKDPRAAYAYAKEELEKEDGPKYSEVIDKMIEDGIIRVVKEVSGDRIWVEVLNKSFFDSLEGSLPFGIECQRNNGPGAKFVLGSQQTYTLLVKGGQGYYSLASIAVDNSDSSFKEIKDAANEAPGKQSYKGNDKNSVADAVLDFMLTELSDFHEYHPWGGTSPSTSCEYNRESGGYGAAGTFCWWLKNKPSFIEQILANPNALEAMEPLIRNTRPDFLEALTIDYNQLLQNDPERFFQKLNVYIGAVKDDLENLLSNFNFQDYLNSNSRKDALLKSIPILIEQLPFEFFEQKIYPHIDFAEFLSKMNRPTIEKALRSIRNKFDKNTKAFLSSFEKFSQDFIKAFGGGIKGFGVLSNLLNVPRLESHQNYRKVDGELVASTERNLPGNQGTTLVDVKISEDDKVLGAKNVRDFFKKNEDWIKSQMTGSDEDKDIQFLRYMLRFSSPQAKQASLKKDKDTFIEYYNKQYKEGKSEIPGLLVLNSLINPQTKELTNKNKFSTGAKSYKFDKKELKSNDFKYLVELLRYYISKSNSKTLGRKIGDAISAIVDTLKESSISKEEINEIILDKFLISKIDKSLNYYSIANWVNNLLPFVEDGTIDRKSIVNFLSSSNVKNMVEKESKSSPTIEYAYKDLLNKIESSNSIDESIRKYISKLLSYKFKK